MGAIGNVKALACNVVYNSCGHGARKAAGASLGSVCGIVVENVARERTCRIYGGDAIFPETTQVAKVAVMLFLEGSGFCKGFRHFFEERGLCGSAENVVERVVYVLG